MADCFESGTYSGNQIPQKWGEKMKHYWTRRNVFVFVMIVLLSISAVQAGEKENTTATAVPVRMTVTLSVLGNRRMPDVGRQDVMVKQGKERVRLPAGNMQVVTESGSICLF